MDEVFDRISFGVGRRDGKAQDHPVIDEIREAAFEPQRELAKTAALQLGTVGAGNHYVDLFRDEDDRVWVGVHFGSRGFGHKTASGFLALAQGMKFGERAVEGEMMTPPVVFPAESELGRSYVEAMNLAGRYAYAGRDVVVAEVLDILGARSDLEVHNNHNFSWLENRRWRARVGRAQGRHAGVPRPAGVRRGDDGRAGGDPRGRRLAGVEGRAVLDGPRRRAGDVAHAGGRQDGHAHGVRRARLPELGEPPRPPGRRALPGSPEGEDVQAPRAHQGRARSTSTAVRDELTAKGIELRGGAADEAPGAYKRLDEVLAYHEGTVRILHRLHPIGVAMAPAETYDPFKD